MECYNKCYLPIPPRDWSRVQNSCSLDNTNDGYVKMPLTGEIVPNSILAEKYAMLNKGNVLQYKANSSNLTKAQRYSKIAKGQWINRNTTWATQSSRGYTNPNTTSLKRAGNVVNIAIDPNTGTIIGPTDAPITCPQDGNTDPIVIPDGGVLICSIQENPCTGAIKQSLGQKLCNPTSDSDVPGTIQDLCWNDGTQTWYPRQRYQMTNSGNKWPVNAQLSSAIRPSAPNITSITSLENIITLIWTQSEKCLPVSRFDIYENGLLIQSVSKTFNTINLNVNNNNTYFYYIIGVTNGSNISSFPSNVVSINISYIEAPSISGSLNTVSYSNASILLNIIPPTNQLVSQYIIYYSYNSISYTSIIIPFTTTYILENLLINKTYTIYITSVASTGQVSIPSNIVNVSTYYQPFTWTVEPLVYNYDTTNKLWSAIFTNTSTITFTQDIASTIFTTIVGGGGGGFYGFGSSGGEAGYQAINSFNYIINGDSFTINAIGKQGLGTNDNQIRATSGTETLFTDPDLNTYLVTGGFAGKASGEQNSGGYYSGPPGTNLYTGNGGYGGAYNQTISKSGGGNSYLYTNSSEIKLFTGINILEYIFNIYGYYIGGGGGTGGSVGGEGGSQNKNGIGGAGSNSNNLNTQDGRGFGSGGGSYMIQNNTPSGNGGNGVFIIFFNYP